MTTDAEILVPDKNIMQVGGRDMEVGKFSIKQGILFGRHLMKTLLTNQEKMVEYAKKIKGNDNNMDDIMDMVGILEERDVFIMMGIILKLYNEKGIVPTEEVDFLEKHLDFGDVTEIMAILCEQDTFSRLKKNIQRIIQAVGKKKPKNN